LNVNTVTIAEYLYRNDAARAAVVTRAEAAVTDTAITTRRDNTAQKDLKALNLPIGWDGEWKLVNPFVEGWWDSVFILVVGWLMTAFAATLGAPFWFDVLNKVMVIRSTVKPHEKSPEESSEDRQKPAPQAATPPVAPAAALVAAVPVPPSEINAARGRDAESDVDGCDIAPASDQEATSDEALPAAEGGVQ
jgi:hypothetical protein